MAGDGTYVDVEEDNFILGSPYQLITNRFDLTQKYAQDSYELTESYLTSLGEAVTEYTLPPSAVLSVDGIDIPYFDYTRRPTVSDVDLEGDFPDNTALVPVPETVPAISPFVKPAKTFSPPSYQTITTPDFIEFTLPEGPGALFPVVPPTAPSLVLPPTPVLEPIVLPAAPNDEVILFDAELPDFSVSSVQPFKYYEQAYNSDIWSDLLFKVLNDIRNGGTGLSVQVESELYERAMERARDENERLMIETEDYFSSRGFDLPPGAMAGRLQEAQNQVSRNNSIVNAEIHIEQEKLAQANTHFMIQKGVELEGILRSFYENQANRSLEAEKNIAINAIEILNGEIALHNLSIDEYKAKAAVFDSRIKASLVKLEKFKVQVESAKVSQEIQGLLVDIYEKQLAGIEVEAKIYATVMDGAKISSDINRNIIEQYRARTEVYVAQQTGQKIKFDAYASQSDAEKVKAEIFAKQIDAYASEVDAEKAVTMAESAIAESIIKQNSSKIDQFKAELFGYAAEIDAASKKVAAKLSGFQAEVSAYSAETVAEGSFYDARSKQITAQIQEASLNLQLAVAEVDASLKGYVAIKELQIKGTDSIMSVGAQLTASAWNAVSATASYGYSSSESLTETWGHRDGLTESHQFVENPS